MKKFARVGLASVAALTMALSACGGGGEGGKTEEGPALTSTEMAVDFNEQPYDKIKEGGTLTLPITEINAQMNTWHADSTAYTTTLWNWYNPVAIGFSADGEALPDPDYITDISDEVKDGKTVVTYTLNEDATFNDGTPIDWHALEAGWKACGELDEAFTCNSTDGYNQIESVTAGENDKQAVVTFKNEFPWWHGLFNTFLHPKAAEAKTFQEGYLNEPHPEWGAGPYKVEKMDPNEGVAVFVPNDKWWGEDKAKLEKVVYQQMESQAALNAFRNGQLDATAVGTQERLKQVDGMEGIEIRRGNDVANRLMMINSKAPMLDDIKVREAIFTAIDRQVIADIAFQGLNYTEELPGSLLYFPFQEGYQDNFGEAVTYDTEKAKKLLEEAGWAAGEDGIYAKDGKKLEINFPIFGDDPTTAAQSKAYQSMLKEAGIQLNIQEKASSDFAKVITAEEFDMVAMAFRSTDPYGPAYACQIWCSNSELNKSATGTPEIDKLLKEEMTAEGTEEGQAEVANKAEAEAFKTYGVMPTYAGPVIIAAKSGLANYGADVFGVQRPQDIGWVEE